jgi:acyl-CoA thioesterase-1
MTPGARAGRIVALGDSMTAGYHIGPDHAFPAVLQARLDAAGYEYSVSNAGVSGDTSRQAAQRVMEALAGDVRILIVAIGVNDGLRGVPVNDLTSHLSRIIEAAQRRGVAVILCGMEAAPIYGRSYAASFHQAYESLALRYRVPLVPFVMLRILGNANLVLPDRIHPNAAGAHVIADQIWPYLQPLLRRIAQKGTLS